jgi:hypothetical protein
MSNTDSSNIRFPNRREHVRVYYPVESKQKYIPVAVIHARTFRVMDISERGLRFANPDINLISNGKLTITLEFPDGTTISLVGRVIRRQYRQVAIRLESGIPYNRIMSEQLRLRKLELDGTISRLDH